MKRSIERPVIETSNSTIASTGDTKEERWLQDHRKDFMQDSLGVLSNVLCMSSSLSSQARPTDLMSATGLSSGRATPVKDVLT